MPSTLQVDLSFQYCKELLLAHSVQRPPYSIGLLTLSEMKAMLAWMLDSYYRHYKLYMYAFTDRWACRPDGRVPVTGSQRFAWSPHLQRELTYAAYHSHTISTPRSFLQGIDQCDAGPPSRHHRAAAPAAGPQ